MNNWGGCRRSGKCVEWRSVCGPGMWNRESLVGLAPPYTELLCVCVYLCVCDLLGSLCGDGQDKSNTSVKHGENLGSITLSSAAWLSCTHCTDRECKTFPPSGRFAGSTKQTTETQSHTVRNSRYQCLLKHSAVHTCMHAVYQTHGVTYSTTDVEIILSFSVLNVYNFGF